MRIGLAAELLTLLKLDGSRFMDSEAKVGWSATEYIDNYDPVVGTYTGLRFKSRDRIAFQGHSYFYGHFYVSGVGSSLKFQLANQYISSGFDFPWKCYDPITKVYVDVLQFIKANPPYMDILKAGDILPVVGKSCGTTAKPFNYMEATHVRGANHLSGGYTHFDPTTGPATPVPGDVRYSSALDKLQVYTGVWETITSA